MSAFEKCGAQATTWGRPAASSYLPDAFAADPDRLARFQREAQVLASLNHPNIAQIYGTEEDTSDGTRALVLELVEGPTLADRIAHGAMPIEDALPIAKQIAEALEAAHEAGIIHRDVKPANIKVREDGTVKVLDFGLAKALEGSGASATADPSQSPTVTAAATQMGVILGTAAYMSPEQARGKPVDRRADIWAFGSVLYEMLVGRRAFGGQDSAEVLAAVIGSEPMWSDLSGRMARIRPLVERCLEKDIRQRWQAIGDVRLEVERALEREDEAPPPHLITRTRHLARWVGGVVAGVLFAGFVAWTWPDRATENGPVIRFSHRLTRGDRFGALTRWLIDVSRDGEVLVYKTTDGLRVRELAVEDSRLIPGTADASVWSVSPNGQSVAFYESTTLTSASGTVAGPLKKIPTAGGVAVTLATIEPAMGIHWESDDAIVLDQPGGLMRVAAAGGALQLLVVETERRALGPQVLPGGRDILFTLVPRAVSGGPEPQIVAANLESGDRTVVLDGVTDARYVPTGHLIYPVGDDLHAVPFDIETMDVTGVGVPVVDGVQPVARGVFDVRTPYSGGDVNFVVTANGTLAYVRGRVATEADRVLALVDRSGTAERLDVPPLPYFSPRLAPDGASLAVQTVESDGRGVIWLYDLAGDTAIRRLTHDGSNIRPIWTRDSRRVTFASDRDGTMSLYSQAVDGSSSAERLTTADDGVVHFPESWSPDGNTLAFAVRRGGSPELWTLSVPTGTPERFPSSPTWASQWASSISPDGRHIVHFAAERAGELWVQPFPPSGERQLVTPGIGRWPIWSPNGREIIYRAVPTFGAETMLMSVDVIASEGALRFGRPRQIPIGGFLTFNAHRTYDVHPDGRRFLTIVPADSEESYESPQPSIAIVLNWTQELLERVPID